MFKGKNVITADDFTAAEIVEIIEYAQEIQKSPNHFSHLCDGMILGTLFFEPSTRTRLSFEAAMLRLGGQCLGFSQAQSSSAAKGESLWDTVKTVSQYADIITMRHPQEGAAKLAAEKSDCPIINAGDGGHQHPTQMLTDVLTIHNEKGGLSGQVIGLCGDLKFGRTVHSFLKAMSLFPDNRFVLISPEELRVPRNIRQGFLKPKGIDYIEVERLEEVIGDLDMLCMTRVQKERFFNEADYVRLKDSYILDKKKMRRAKEDMVVLHPLPRVNEIAVEVDEDPRAVYFKQAKNGMYVRMSLIAKILGVDHAGH